MVGPMTNVARPRSPAWLPKKLQGTGANRAEQYKTIELVLVTICVGAERLVYLHCSATKNPGKTALPNPTYPKEYHASMHGGAGHSMLESDSSHAGNQTTIRILGCITPMRVEAVTLGQNGGQILDHQLCPMEKFRG